MRTRLRLASRSVLCRWQVPLCSRLGGRRMRSSRLSGGVLFQRQMHDEGLRVRCRLVWAVVLVPAMPRRLPRSPRTRKLPPGQVLLHYGLLRPELQCDLRRRRGSWRGAASSWRGGAVLRSWSLHASSEVCMRSGLRRRPLRDALMPDGLLGPRAVPRWHMPLCPRIWRGGLCCDDRA